VASDEADNNMRFFWQLSRQCNEHSGTVVFKTNAKHCT